VPTGERSPRKQGSPILATLAQTLWLLLALVAGGPIVYLLAFVAAYPGHAAADNALYLVGLVREARGDCAGALPLFESVPRKYPAGDAVAQALLERGRCLRILGRKDEAKSVLNQLSQEHPDAPETARSKALLQDL